jgi:gliding motility-associated-like protein
MICFWVIQSDLKAQSTFITQYQEQGDFNFILNTAEVIPYNRGTKDRIEFLNGPLNQVALSSVDECQKNQWTRITNFSNPNYQQGYSLAKTTDQAIYTFLKKDSSDGIKSFGKELLLYKFDTTGKQEWREAFQAGPANGFTYESFDVHLTMDQNLLVAAHLNRNKDSFLNRKVELLLFKISPGGQVLWKTNHQLPDKKRPYTQLFSRSNQALDVKELPDSSVVISGQSDWIAHFSQQGQLQNLYKYQTPKTWAIDKLEVDPKGNIYALGSYGADSSFYNAFAITHQAVVKLNSSNFRPVWGKYLKDYHFLEDAVNKPGEGLTVLFSRNPKPFNSGNVNPVLAQLDAKGAVNWAKVYPDYQSSETFYDDFQSTESLTMRAGNAGFMFGAYKPSNFSQAQVNFEYSLHTDDSGRVTCASAPTTLTLNDFQVTKQTSQDYQRLQKPELKVSNDAGTWTAINTEKEIICSDSLFPQANLNDTVFCQSNPRPLNAGSDTSAFTYRWNTGDTTPTITVDTGGQYKVSVSYRGCTVTDSGEVTFLRRQTPEIGRDTFLCGKEDSLQVNLPGNGEDYLWQTPGDPTAGEADTVQKLQQWVKARGDYKLYRADQPECLLDEFKLRKFIRPSIKIPDSATICPYDSTHLNPSLSSPFLYNWQQLSARSVAANASTAWLADSGRYVLRDDASACPLDTFELNYHRLPDAQAGPDTQLCQDQVYTMQGKGGITYRWIPAKYLSSDTIPDPEVKLPEKQAYQLIVANQAGCRDTSSVQLAVLPPLAVEIPERTAICEHQPLKLSARGDGGRPSNYRYQWKPLGQKGQAVTWQRPRVGEVRVTLSDGCSPPVTDKMEVKALDAPVADFETNPSDTVFVGDSLRVTNQGQGSSQSYWQFTSTGNLTVADNPTHVYESAGKKTVTLVTKRANRCQDTARQEVFVTEAFQVHIPNAFSPDGNGVNDQWQVKGLGIQSYEFTIYNRWGEQVYESQPGKAQPSWEGKHTDGRQVPQGPYLYTLTVTDYSGRAHFYEGRVAVLY